jgi:uncharacterized membrane protein
MLSKRSKILITIACFAAFVSLLGHIHIATAWQKEFVPDRYVEWILLAAWIAIAVFSVLLDVRRNR